MCECTVIINGKPLSDLNGHGKLKSVKEKKYKVVDHELKGVTTEISEEVARSGIILIDSKTGKRVKLK